MRGAGTVGFSLLKALETERGLKSSRGVRHNISARLLEIKTMGELWSISISMGVGAQVVGALMQHVQTRWGGRENERGTYSSASFASMNSSKSSLLTSSSKTVVPSKTAVTVEVPCFFFLYVVLAFVAWVAVTFLQSSAGGQGFVQLWLMCSA